MSLEKENENEEENNNKHHVQSQISKAISNKKNEILNLTSQQTPTLATDKYPKRKQLLKQKTKKKKKCVIGWYPREESEEMSAVLFVPMIVQYYVPKY